MFNKVLVANRGAIAVRIINTLKKMGIASVSIYAEVDKDSLHVQNASEIYSLGEGAVTDTYLNADKIIAIAKECGADAIHPGYGFLSENSDFVALCEANNIAFIGPKSEQIEIFGLKHTARALALENNIPLLPGTGLLQSLEDAVNQAEDIRYPVILKSTAGGGGIGMQVCRNAQELEQSFITIKRLSANNFANDAVFLEKYIENARHIEVQVFGDGEGKAVAFGERDCSTQRRHQKVIEETPAPNLSDELRSSLEETAIRLVESVNYRNAGTVEFIFDANENKFYFLEVNTRLQVEHGVTEQVFDVDLVEWMVKLSAGKLGDIRALRQGLKSTGHAIQVRVYAENPTRDFQPSAGLLSEVYFPEADNKALRIDSWIESGIEVSAYFDPMLAKVIVYSNHREQALKELSDVLAQCRIHGVETNASYVRQVLSTDAFKDGRVYTHFLNKFQYSSNNVDVLSSGTMTTLQDFPGRTGYWDVGVPPSGPFDNYSFRLANRLVGNSEKAVGLEITLNGPRLKFHRQTLIAICGAEIDARVCGELIPLNTAIEIRAGDVLDIGKVKASGARAYLAVAGGFESHEYLGSKSTFTLGKFGGHCGRALRTGDVLHIDRAENIAPPKTSDIPLPEITSTWTLHTIYGPHGAPDFFTDEDVATFFNSEWTVHYNSSRTGIRLIGPKPQWARESGGEAGMHPSNIHDNAYAIGAIDFTGDMPVILGPDGPSLGGFVCPATVISADLWKLGQLKAGDKIRFALVSHEEAVRLEAVQDIEIAELSADKTSVATLTDIPKTPVIHQCSEEENGVQVVYRQSGDKNILIEYGPPILDLRLRFRVHALMNWLSDKNISGVQELTPGIRSLQVHYDSLSLARDSLLTILKQAENELGNMDNIVVPSRTVHIPLSWNDAACQEAVEKYIRSVRSDAPWCPDNIEFIRRINGLGSVEEVKDIVFSARYVVMGLGDVYLGAPVATPMDPRKRLVTTKYNPARTWTAENSVGIGGAYLCIYGMEGPGGYQFIGRTLQMWNKFRQTPEFEKPWLLRFFDQIRFYEVSAEELVDIREKFPRGQYPLKIEEGEFSLKSYEAFLNEHAADIDAFIEKRDFAFREELDRWIANGQMNFESDTGAEEGVEHEGDDGAHLVESNVAGNIWKWLVAEGDSVKEGDTLCVLESMKMEIEIYAPHTGVVDKILRAQGQQVGVGQALVSLNPSE